jgi:hypothetical protein
LPVPASGHRSGDDRGPRPPTEAGNRSNPTRCRSWKVERCPVTPLPPTSTSRPEERIRSEGRSTARAHQHSRRDGEINDERGFSSLLTAPLRPASRPMPKGRPHHAGCSILTAGAPPKARSATNRRSRVWILADASFPAGSPAKRAAALQTRVEETSSRRKFARDRANLDRLRSRINSTAARAD